MRTLQPGEITLIGDWIVEGTLVRGDEMCRRIEWLTSVVLKKVGYSKDYGAWETLYQDPNDGRYWVKTYPQSHMHGGGPPALTCLSEQEARSRFDFN
ncbi:MAG: Imm27 family immunity protein [Gammaproteobacteria bacterium]